MAVYLRLTFCPAGFELGQDQQTPAKRQSWFVAVPAEDTFLSLAEELRMRDSWA